MAILLNSCIVFVLIFLSNFIAIKSFKYSEKPSPIILVPGNGGSRAYKYDKHAPFFKTSLVWVNLIYFVLPQRLNKVFRLEYDPNTHRTRNVNNNNILFPGWGSTENIESLNNLPLLDSVYYGNLVHNLIKDKYYVRNKTIRGAPYDFRKAPNENNNFVGNLKQLVEDTYSISSNQRVVLLCHSLGCLYSLHFLKQMDISWKRKYLRTFISVSAPLGGSVQALISLTYGISFHSPGKEKFFREMEKTFPSVVFLLPKSKLYKNESLIITPKRSYSVYDYKELFTDISMPFGEMMYNDSRDLINTWDTPEGIDEIYCIYSKGIATSKQLIFTSFPNTKPKIKNEDGDGTVSIRSLEICRTWNNTQYEVFENMEHIDLIKSHSFIEKIKTILYKQQNFQFQFNKNLPNIL